MDSTLINQVAANGVFGALFVWLLFYVLKQNEKRETALMRCLERLTESYETLKDKVSDIEEALCGKKGD